VQILRNPIPASPGPWANDTSCGAGFAPLTELERIVLDVDRALGDRETHAAHPELGSDVKVMGVRRRKRIDLTIACAFVDRHVDG
jgi:S-adenosylmethionine synthetase